MNCKCGSEIPQKRIEILLKNSSPVTCIKCSSVERKVGFQVSVGKTEYFIEPVTPDQYKRLNSLDRKAI